MGSTAPSSSSFAPASVVEEEPGDGPLRCSRQTSRYGYGALMIGGDWDERYASHDDGLWSGRANGVLLAELAEILPGRALDVGCGEGADAIWLARAGWQVTGVDVSEVALGRAAAGARDAGVTVEWLRADIAMSPPSPGGYDLVSVHYPALKHSRGDEAIRALLDAVAPGGTLLVVGHAPLDHDHARAHGFEIADYVQPADVRARLDEGWEVEVDETRPRVDPAPEGSSHTHDVVLRAKRHR
jgi:SAM-dependent methyltransferase